ncbi:MAG: hypothetical protein CM15mP6_3090 [Methanobacteriota archaeon]|nr:MAG: hypothetical protein CM15mP6_3090 [Euryarchaeota archaeon]
MTCGTSSAITLGGPVEVLDEGDPFVVLGVLIIVTATLLAFTLVFVFYRKDPEAFDWDNFAPWLADWLTTTDHKKIGTLYFIAGLFFLGVGGIMAMIIRIQLAVPGNDFLTQEQYNQFFTLHGTTMIFLAAMPMINGFANWMIPSNWGSGPGASKDKRHVILVAAVAALLIFTGVFSGHGADTGGQVMPHTP